MRRRLPGARAAPRPGGLAVRAGAVRRAFADRQRRRGRERRIDAALPAMIDALSAAMRAGASPASALADLDPPADLSEPVAAMRAAIATGTATRDALTLFAERAGTPLAGLACVAITIGIDSGGDVPRILDVIAESARDRVRIRREAHVASTQARLSAWIVGALPVAFLIVTGSASREQVRLLVGTPAGWALLIAGGAFEAAGLAWMRRLTR